MEEEQGDGRRQLLALFPDAHKTKPTLHKLRIEEIHDLQVYPMESSLSMPCTSAETSTEIHLRIHWNTMEEKQVLVSRLREELPAISILEETNNMMHCSFSCSDQKKYLPVLRTFLPYVELLPKPKTYLFKKMQCDIIETLALYENQPYMRMSPHVLHKNLSTRLHQQQRKVAIKGTGLSSLPCSKKYTPAYSDGLSQRIIICVM